MVPVRDAGRGRSAGCMGMPTHRRRASGVWASREHREVTQLRSYRLGELLTARGACDHVRVIVRPQEPRDYEAANVVYAEAFRRRHHGDRVPPEVGIFAALWQAKDVIDELSFTASAQNAAVGSCDRKSVKVGFDSVVAVGPIGVLPDHQAKGIGSALMNALLSAADAQDVPLVVLLGSPQYYGRFGFRPAVELGVMPPEPRWGSAFQARPLRVYTPSVAGPFEYAPAFSS